MFDFKSTLKEASKSAWLVIKLIVPLYILADILLYFDMLRYVIFLFEPITDVLDLPKEAALGIGAGMLFNLYAGIAFLAPLGLTGYEWTILATFLGIAHSLPIENSVMKKLGISHIYSLSLRICVAFLAVFILIRLPKEIFDTSVVSVSKSIERHVYSSFDKMFFSSVSGACVLTIKVVLLVSMIIFMMSYLKSTKWMQDYSQKVNSLFSIVVGLVLGITYGAGILLHEAKTGALTKVDIFYIATFLMICHSVIEDVLLFVLFGANGFVVVVIRLLLAILLSVVFVKVYKKVNDE